MEEVIIEEQNGKEYMNGDIEKYAIPGVGAIIEKEIDGENYSSAVLIGEDDWKSIEETLFMMSIPGMRESIIDGVNTPIEELSEDLDWLFINY